MKKLQVNFKIVLNSISLKKFKVVIVSTQKTQLGISSSQISVCAFLHRIAGANDFRFLFSGGFNFFWG